MQSSSGQARTGSRPRSSSPGSGRSVHVVERRDQVGGGAHTAELTLPGFRHDLCSAVHPLAVGSPALSSLHLERHGLELVFPEIQVAHPLDDGSAVAVRRSVAETAAGLGEDARAYESLIGPFAQGWERLSGRAARATAALAAGPAAGRSVRADGRVLGSGAGADRVQG